MSASATAIKSTRRGSGRFGAWSDRVRSFPAVWRAIVFAQVLVAYMAIYVAGENELHPLSIAIFLPAWMLGLAMRRPPAWWRGWMGTVLTLSAVGALIWFGQSAFFSSILYLLVFLVLAKAYELRTPKDHLQTQVLCFFMILSTAVISVSIHFAFFFLIYLMLATAGFILYGLARKSGSWLEAARAGDASGTGGERGVLPRRFFGSSGLNSGLILVLSILIFYLLPHVSILRIDAPLSSMIMEEEPVTGFSEVVTLGSFKRLVADMTDVMSVGMSWPEGADRKRPASLRLRGVALDTFENNSWRRHEALADGSPRTRPEASRLLNSFGPEISTAQRGRATLVEIHQDPKITMRLFGPSFPQEIAFRNGARHEVTADPRTGTARVSTLGGSRENTFTDRLVYEVRSNVVEEGTGLLTAYVKFEQEERIELAELIALNRVKNSDELLRRAEETLDALGNEKRKLWLSGKTGDAFLTPGNRVINTQLQGSALLDRILEYSYQVVPEDATDAEIVLRLTERLRGDFNYTIEPGTPPGMDPIEAFFFETRQGHCEYFATALVMMLRARGIPSRLINGYYCTEWNGLAEVFMVKQIDAHSWTEVWLDELGWITMDPTPAGSEGRGAYGETGISVTSAWWEFLRLQWERRFIDYNLDRQLALFQEVREGEWSMGAFVWMSRIRDRLGASADGGEAGEPEPLVRSRWADVADWILLLGVLTLMAATAIWLRGYLRRRAARTHIDYFDRLVRRLERFGLRRPEAQTPLEFMRSLQRSGWGSGELSWLVQLYYRQRFAGVPASAAERTRAMGLIRDLRPPRVRPA